jgi:hypothetical protein
MKTLYYFCRQLVFCLIVLGFGLAVVAVYEVYTADQYESHTVTHNLVSQPGWFASWWRSPRQITVEAVYPGSANSFDAEAAAQAAAKAVELRGVNLTQPEVAAAYIRDTYRSHGFTSVTVTDGAAQAVVDSVAKAVE